MATNHVNIPVVEEIDDWVSTKRAAELMSVELPSVGAIIHDGRVKACRIAGVFLVDKASATEFGKKREAQVQAEAARKARSEQLAKLLAQVEGEAGGSDTGATEEVADKVE